MRQNAVICNKGKVHSLTFSHLQVGLCVQESKASKWSAKGVVLKYVFLHRFLSLFPLFPDKTVKITPFRVMRIHHPKWHYHINLHSTISETVFISVIDLISWLTKPLKYPSCTEYNQNLGHKYLKIANTFEKKQQIHKRSNFTFQLFQIYLTYKRNKPHFF